MKQLGTKLLIGLTSLFDGFCLGSLIGAPFVPENAGMVGGAIVFWYGVLGGILFLTTSIILIRKAEPTRLRRILLITGGLALVCVIGITLRIAYLSQAG